jgi:hypothetical protein
MAAVFALLLTEGDYRNHPIAAVTDIISKSKRIRKIFLKFSRPAITVNYLSANAFANIAIAAIAMII